MLISGTEPGNGIHFGDSSTQHKIDAWLGEERPGSMSGCGGQLVAEDACGNLSITWNRARMKFFFKKMDHSRSLFHFFRLF